MPGFLRELVAAYGSFLLFRRPGANLLVLGCTLLQPWAGLCGLTGGAAALGARLLLGLSDRSHGLDGVNGLYRYQRFYLLVARSYNLHFAYIGDMPLKPLKSFL